MQITVWQTSITNRRWRLDLELIAEGKAEIISKLKSNGYYIDEPEHLKECPGGFEFSDMGSTFFVECVT